MFYRRKVLLSLLEIFGGQLEKIVFQKLLFMFTIKQQNPVYHFIPYHYGSYSISANADLTAMVNKNVLCEDIKKFSKNDNINYVDKLTLDDRVILDEINQKYSKLSNYDLMKVTYKSFPYYAINSKTAQHILSKSDYSKVLSSKPKSNRTILFTIGYEGISLEEYLNSLIKNDIKVLVDVRFNPLSRKFGFSKNQLKRFCNSVNIEYSHIPEVGIRSEYRKNVESQEDYRQLFARYESIDLKKTVNQQLLILKLLKEKKRIALTCFESEINKCHRTILAQYITKLPDWNFQLKHI